MNQAILVMAVVVMLDLGALSAQGREAIARSKQAIIFTGGSGHVSSTSTAEVGGFAATVSGRSFGGDFQLSTSAQARNGDAVARRNGHNGERAEVIAHLIASPQGRHARAWAVVQAAKDGESDALAVAIDQAMMWGKKDKAVEAIVDAHAMAINYGEHTSFGTALGVGVIHGGSSAIAFSEAISILLWNKGCEEMEPILQGAMNGAISTNKLHTFVDAFEADFEVIKCAFPACEGNSKHCCSFAEDVCFCENGECSYTLWRPTPMMMWECKTNCEVDHNICVCN